MKGTVFKEDILYQSCRETGINTFPRVGIGFQIMMTGEHNQRTGLGTRHILAGTHNHHRRLAGRLFIRHRSVSKSESSAETRTEVVEKGAYLFLKDDNDCNRSYINNAVKERSRQT